MNIDLTSTILSEMLNGPQAWEFRSGFHRRLQEVSFRTVAAILF